MLKACIFDLDGVIVDTAKFHYQAWKELANKLGFEFTEADNERLKGVSRMQSLEILLEIGGITGLSEEEKLKLAEEKNNRYRQLISTLTPKDILPGVMDFLNEAKKMGKKLAVASSSKNAKFILEKLQLLNFFDAIVDGYQISKAKPDPEIFLKTAEKLSVAPEEAVVFEDAVAGIEAAKRAGMKAVGVGDTQILKEADLVINGFENVNCDWILKQLENLF